MSNGHIIELPETPEACDDEKVPGISNELWVSKPCIERRRFAEWGAAWEMHCSYRDVEDFYARLGGRLDLGGKPRAQVPEEWETAGAKSDATDASPSSSMMRIRSASRRERSRSRNFGLRSSSLSVSKPEETGLPMLADEGTYALGKAGREVGNGELER